MGLRAVTLGLFTFLFACTPIDPASVRPGARTSANFGHLPVHLPKTIEGASPSPAIVSPSLNPSPSRVFGATTHLETADTAPVGGDPQRQILMYRRALQVRP